MDALWVVMPISVGIVAWIWWRIGGRACNRTGCEGVMDVFETTVPAGPDAPHTTRTMKYEECNMCGRVKYLDEIFQTEHIQVSTDPQEWARRKHDEGF